MRLLGIAVLFVLFSVPASADTRVFDFGLHESPVQTGAVAVAPDTAYSAERGYGWVGNSKLEARDRGLKDKLRRDFVFGVDTTAFRVDLPEGYYRVTIITGDCSAGNHVLTVEAEGQVIVRELQPIAGEIVEYAFTIKVADGSLDLTLTSPVQNWVLNGLEIATVEGPGEPTSRKTAVLMPLPSALSPIAHRDRLHLIKKPDYSTKSYPNTADMMRILERFPMYSERGWHANYLDNPALGYFGDSNHGEMGLRAMGNYIFVTALLATDPAYDSRPSGISRETLLARARACLAYMTRAHVTGDLECADGFQWGNDWQSAWWSARMGAGARILWPSLTAQERANAERVIVHEANRHLLRTPPSGATSDTKSEENAWDSEVLAWAAGMFPGHPNAQAWRLKLTEFCMNTLSTPRDKIDSTPVDGKPVKDWMVTANIHDDYTIENHGAYHFCYMACPLHSLAWGYEGLVGAGEEAPDAMFHHYQDVWRWIKRGYIGDGRFAYLSGKDWPRYAYGLSFVLPATVVAQLRFGDPDARRMERDRIALLEREQLINADGSFYGGRFTRNILGNRTAEYETDTYANLALCYLLHHHGETPPPTDPEKLSKHLSGSWSSADSGWSFGRSSKIFASFSWRYLGGIRPVGLFIPTGCAHMAEWMPNQLVGQFQAEGAEARKAKFRHAETKSKIAFSTTGEIVHANSAGAPMVHQQVSFTALTGEGIAVVLERTIAVAPIKLKSSRAVNLALANDVFNGSVRQISHQGKGIRLTGARNLGTVEAAKPGANATSSTLRSIHSWWLCVDQKLGIALLDMNNFTIQDYSGRNAPWGSVQYDVISAHDRGQRELKAGDSILDSAFVLIAGDGKTTAQLQASSLTGAVTGHPAVRYAVVTAPSGKRYLVVANLDGVARTVRVPGFPEAFQFTGFGAEVRQEYVSTENK